MFQKHNSILFIQNKNNCFLNQISQICPSAPSAFDRLYSHHQKAMYTRQNTMNVVTLYEDSIKKKLLMLKS